jgi:pSer/pThr/pTyr-binding forkhead associated (FHA) protein
MSTVQQSTFIITREDRAEDAKTIISDGLRIGRLTDSDILVNHPTISRLHAGISEIGGYFYLINLSASSATTLNGRVIPFNESEALSPGDEIQIGPYFLNIEDVDEGTETLRIKVTRQFALNVGERETRQQEEVHQKQLSAESRPQVSSEATDALKVFWGKRSREKAGRPSPLHPHAPPRPGKARYNWRPTRDLVRPWPFSIFIWAFIAVGALSVMAAYKYKTAFTPRPLSAPHTRSAFTLTPAIARQPNASSCTSCHAVRVSMDNRERMNANCASCHQAEGFSATITRVHRDAGITCIDCHAEHKGESFSPMEAALASCEKCHSDSNKNLYQGRSVHTPHGGTYGYPVINGVWVWKGLDEEELAEKPELVALLKQNRLTPGPARGQGLDRGELASEPNILELLKQNRLTPSQAQQWQNVLFHAIHIYRVHVSAGFAGIEDVNAVNGELSCSSCHKSGYMGVNVDRTFPRTTCAKCHNDQVFHKSTRSMLGMEMPSCTSCHVQHFKDRHWLPTFFRAQAGGVSGAGN